MFGLVLLPTLSSHTHAGIHTLHARAGQGYIWMSHRTPGNAAWDLAAWSTREWRKRAAGDMPLRNAVQWQVGRRVWAVMSEP